MDSRHEDVYLEATGHSALGDGARRRRFGLFPLGLSPDPRHGGRQASCVCSAPRAPWLPQNPKAMEGTERGRCKLKRKRPGGRNPLAWKDKRGHCCAELNDVSARLDWDAIGWGRVWRARLMHGGHRTNRRASGSGQFHFPVMYCVGKTCLRPGCRAVCWLGRRYWLWSGETCSNAQR